MSNLHQTHIAKALENIPYAKELAIYPFVMGDELTLILPYAPHIIGNPMLQALHGGAVGAFMETTAIIQLWLMGDLSAHTDMENAPTDPELSLLPKPIGINLDYLRRGKPKNTFARAHVTRQGSRVANVRVRAWQDNYHNPISTLHGNFLTAKSPTHTPSSTK